MSILVTAYRQSGPYTREYVDRLRSAAHFAGATLRVVEDYRWPGWWCKMALFDPANTALPDGFLYCDLDTIVTGDLSDLMSAGRPMMLRDFFFPSRPASGVMFLTDEIRARVWRRWMESPDRWMRQYRGVSKGGDGAFLADTIKPKAFLQDEFPGQIASFKVDCMDKPPANARLVCYHGKPRPHETNWTASGSRRWVKGVPKTSLRCPRGMPK